MILRKKSGVVSLEDITSNIFQRTPVLEFDQRDIGAYDWETTRYFYGRGHYLGALVYADTRRGEIGAIPILHNDSQRTWSVPFYRHYQRKLEFFVPGITLGVPDRYILGYKFYPLNEEEREHALRILHEEFDIKILKEKAALEEYLGNFCTTPPHIAAVPGKINVLFGSEVYKGEDPEKFKERMLHIARPRPSVEIWV